MDIKNLSTQEIEEQIAVLQAELTSRDSEMDMSGLWFTLAQLRCMQVHHPKNAKYESHLYPVDEEYCVYTLKESVLYEVGDDGELLPLSYDCEHDQAVLEGKFRLVVESKE
jgi:hypothetical protein